MITLSLILVNNIYKYIYLIVLVLGAVDKLITALNYCKYRVYSVDNLVDNLLMEC